MYQISPMNWILIFFSFIYLIFFVFFFLMSFEKVSFILKNVKKIYVK